MRALTDTLEEKLIQAKLSSLEPAVPFYFFEEIPTTIDKARELFSKCGTPLFAVLARRMTAGRGRWGRRWVSQAENVALTIGVSGLLEKDVVSLFSLYTGIIVSDLLKELLGVKVFVKWPNDIIISDKKAGGILIEAVNSPLGVFNCLVSVGLNVNDDGSTWPPELDDKAISLLLVKGVDQPINEIASGLIVSLVRGIRGANKESLSKELKQNWSHYDYLSQKNIRLVSGDKEVEGVALGVDENGALLIENAEGRFAFSSGEASILSYD